MDDNKKSPIIERLTQFIDYTGLTNSQFADRADIPRPSLSQMFHGRNKSLNNHVLSKLNAAFPNLNIVWLLFGTGNMLNDSNIEFSEPQIGRNEVEESLQSPENNALTDGDAKLDLGLFADANRNFGEKAAATPRNTPLSSPACEAPDGISQIIASQQGNTKQIKSIIVFYTDNSFETFLPLQD